MTPLIPELSPPVLVGGRVHIPRLLKRLGMPFDIAPTEAISKVTECIVYARKLGNDDAAARWSAIKAVLKQRMLHLCEGGCGNRVDSRHSRCRMCHNDYVRAKRLTPKTPSQPSSPPQTVSPSSPCSSRAV